QAFNARGFYADIFYSSAFFINHNKIADLKRAVEKDNKVVEKVAEYVLCSKCNGNTTNTQTGNYSSNFITQIIEKEKQANSPDNYIYDEHNSAQLFYFFFAAFLPPHKRAQNMQNNSRKHPD